jgi:hypothetical protein
MTVSLSLQITHEDFFSQTNSFLAIILQLPTEFNISASKVISRQDGVSKLDSILLIWTLNDFAQTVQKTQAIYCWEGVLTVLLHSNGSHSIVTCLSVAAGICLPSRCLAMDVSSDFAINFVIAMSKDLAVSNLTILWTRRWKFWIRQLLDFRNRFIEQPVQDYVPWNYLSLNILQILQISSTALKYFNAYSLQYLQDHPSWKLKITNIRCHVRHIMLYVSNLIGRHKLSWSSAEQTDTQQHEDATGRPSM